MRSGRSKLRPYMPLLAVLLFIIFAHPVPALAQPMALAQPAEDVCPVEGVQPRPAVFESEGLILTTFDRSGLWVVNPARGSRYPLENTSVCGTNCHLSPDLRWFSYLEPLEGHFSMMRLDGSERTPLTSSAATEADWWSDDTLIVWSPAQNAYLQAIGSDERETLNVDRVVSVQPRGRWTLSITQDESGFQRQLTHLDGDSAPIPLGEDRQFFNAAAWSPDGRYLAYVAPDNGVPLTAALFGVDPREGSIETWATFNSPVRIGGQTGRGGLSWSPDGKRVAFWVMPYEADLPLLDNPTPQPTASSDTDGSGAPLPPPELEHGAAYIHVYDVETRRLQRFCGYSTPDHVPNPPRLVWSPDGRYVAFGSDVENDTRGVLLIGLDVTSGIYTEISYGIFPALGGADVIAWGLAP